MNLRQLFQSKTPDPLGPSTNGIYAIVDLVAGVVIGGLQVHRHAAAAVRMFNDIATADGTAINKHPEDFQMIYLGRITEDTWTISALDKPEVVITGRAWKAAQPLALVKEA